jgi:hypothetical protein
MTVAPLFPTRVGAVRPSQLLHTYGVGSLVDLPNFSVIVAGLQAWDQPREEIIEPRLLAAVRAQLGIQVERLIAMPWMEPTNNINDQWARVGIPVLPFPRWMRCTSCNVLSTIDGGLFTLDKSGRLDRIRYVHKNCTGNAKSPMAVPARFIMACPKGHLDEFPWVAFAHHNRPCPNGGGGNLTLTEPGSGTRSTDVVVKCTACGQSNVISAAFDRDAKDLPKCRGRHPHLRRFDAACEEVAETLLLGASNTWFGVTRSALWFPYEASSPVDREVDELWSDLAGLRFDDAKTLEVLIAAVPTLDKLRSFPIADVWGVVERRRSAAEETGQAGDLRLPEWQCFVDPANAPKDKDFTISTAGVPPAFRATVAAVVAATRLRETTALVGFARIDAPDSGLVEDAELESIVPLSTEPPRWVPAAEVRGEGVFVRLPEERVRAWESRVGNHERMLALRQAILARHGPKAWLGVRYVLLHSLAHLLINELAFECGYGAASLRERIYSSNGEDGSDPMAGFLIYTAAADSEGTLGGLVSMAKPDTFGRVLERAIDRAQLCSSDPLCAEHMPTPEDRTLHGAACHSCLFLPETSCERNNRLLDRAALAKTLTNSGISYLGD